jgi:hypothetical protein
MADEVRADEPAPAGYQTSHEVKVEAEIEVEEEEVQVERFASSTLI